MARFAALCGIVLVIATGCMTPVTGPSSPTTTTVPPPPLTGVVQIAAGGEHTCAVMTGGTVDCWGYNGDGELGNGTTAFISLRVQVTGITNAVQVTAGEQHSCALLADGTVDCWGADDYGQLSIPIDTSLPTFQTSSVPVAVAGLTGVTEISASGMHTCALLTDGTIECWGEGSGGELGDGATTLSSTPVVVTGISDAVYVAAGGYHTCALLADGTVDCWGGNSFAQLGNGTATDSSIPLTVPGITGATALTAGADHTCAVVADGAVTCWGYNYWGGLGNGTSGPDDSTAPPGPVVGLTGATQLAGGSLFTCAGLGDQTVSCWGNNFGGQLGNGTSGEETATDTAGPVTGLTNVVGLAAGDAYTCAVLTDGTAKCWGYNSHGELGDGSTLHKATPVSVI